MDFTKTEDSSLCVCVASHNTLSTRREGLIGCIRSLNEAVQYFKKSYPEIPVTISWVDDGSADDTWEYVQDHIQVPFVGEKLRVVSHQSYARNLASRLTDANLLFFCDSDDRFFQNHLTSGYEKMIEPGPAGKHWAIAYSQAFYNPSLNIHDSWRERIAYTIPLTKIIHRTAWQFIEGFPDQSLYGISGSEDEHLMLLLASVFQIGKISEETVEYCCYPNSFFESQLEKFQHEASQAQPTRREREHIALHQANSSFIKAKLELLKAKLLHTDWNERLSSFAVSYKMG